MPEPMSAPDPEDDPEPDPDPIAGAVIVDPLVALPLDLCALLDEGVRTVNIVAWLMLLRTGSQT